MKFKNQLCGLFIGLASLGVSSHLMAVEIVSRSSDGLQGNQQSSPANISADGRFIVYASFANNLVPSDTNHININGGADIFVHDRITGSTERVSVSSSGEQAQASTPFGYVVSQFPSISADGRFSSFSSNADNIVPFVTNNDADWTVHDRVTRVNERVNVSSSGEQANGVPSPYYSNIFAAPIYAASISDNGRFVAFFSDASNLVSDDTNGSQDIFIRDRETGITKRISASSAGEQGNSGSFFPSISADGRSVSFVPGG